MVRDNNQGEIGDMEGGAPSAGARPRLRDFSRSLPMSLLKAREAVMRPFRAELHHIGITEQQWRVLRALTAVQSIEVTALAQATFLLPPSLSRILKDLEERELILRRTSKEDMRRGIVSISKKGQRLIDVTGRQSEAIYDEITRRFGAVKLTSLQSMLRELEAALVEPIETRADTANEDSSFSTEES